MQKDFAGVKRAMGVKAKAVIDELGADAWQAGKWESGMGQIGLYVTPQGLTRLQQSSNAISFWPDKTWSNQTHVGNSDGSLDELERQLASSGYVDVIVTLNLESLEFDHGADGKISFKSLPQASADFKGKAASVLNALSETDAVNKFAATQSASDVSSGKKVFDPQITLRVNREGLVKLSSNTSVRKLMPVGFADQRLPLIEPGLIEEAQRHGSVRVLISVRTPLSAGALSNASVRSLTASHQRSLSDFATRAGVTAKWTNIPEFGVAAADLTYADLQRMVNTPDARLQGIYLNKPIAEVKLERSTAATATNAQRLWSNVPPLTAAGQTIVVMDSGIQRNHPFFRKSATDATSRVNFEACFGTNNTDYESLCLGRDAATGDSPPGTIGSGEPYEGLACGDADGCSHGTHVAGIAAGKWQAGMPTGRQGVAHDASIASVNVFSYRRKTSPTAPRSGAPLTFREDYLLALQLLGQAANVPSAANPFVVNMSIASEKTYIDQTACSKDAVFTTPPPLAEKMQSAIDFLYGRGVPVVAATGNNGVLELSFPSCLKNVIKVASVHNGPVPALSGFSNITRESIWGGDPIFLAPGGSFYAPNAGPIFSSSVNANIALPLSDVAWWRGMQGTSQATPHVSGLMAAIKAAAPGCTVKWATDWIRANGSIAATYNIEAGLPNGNNYQTYRLIKFSRGQ